MAKISVIIPVYNTEKYLSRCLDSVLNQTFQDIEVVCINDGSTDNSLKILRQYAKKDKRIKLMSQENKGLSVTRNVGLKNISGKYVSFIDSDDYIDRNYYEWLIGLMEKNDADIVMAGMRTVNDGIISDNITPDIMTDDFIEKIKNLPNGSTCDKLYKANLFKNLEFPVGRYYEDNIVLLKIMYIANKVIFTNKVSYYYFINNSGICRSTDNTIIKKRNEDMLYSAKMMLNFAKKHGFEQSEDIKNFVVRTVAYGFTSKQSPYYKQIKYLLGRRYLRRYNAKTNKILIKNFLLRMLCMFVPLRNWRHKIKNHFNR